MVEVLAWCVAYHAPRLAITIFFIANKSAFSNLSANHADLKYTTEFTLTFKSLKLYLSGKNKVNSRFHSLAVRIMLQTMVYSHSVHGFRRQDVVDGSFPCSDRLKYVELFRMECSSCFCNSKFTCFLRGIVCFS